MDQNLSRSQDPGMDLFFDESQAKKKSFDFVLWFYRILKYWYLFVISISIFFAYAYLKNKAWVPSYVTQATLMLESRGNVGVSIGGIPTNAMLRGVTNQRIILNSYDMALRTVARLPQMRVDYFIKTKFKVENLYGRTPITIDAKFVAPSAFDIVFEIEPINSEKCRIFYEGSENTPPFSMEVPYGEYIQEKRFYIKIDKTERFSPNFAKFSFRFVSTAELTNRFAGRVQANLREENSTALILSMYGPNALQDVDFMRELLIVYEEYNLTLKNEAADQTIAFIDRQINIIGDSLQTSENAFRNYQEETGIFRIESQNSRNQLETSNQALGEIKAQEDMLLMLTEDINTSILNNTELTDPSSLGVTDAKISGYISDYNSLVSKMNNMAEAHPMYQKTKIALTGLRIKILEELRSIQDQTQGKKENIENQIKDIEGKITTLPTQEREYTKYEKTYQINESYYSFLRQKRYDVTIQKASNIPDNFVMEQPRVNGGAYNVDEKSQTYLFCLLIGLAIPLGFVICKEELFNSAISTKEECENLSGLPVIGTIENISKKMTSGASATLVKNFPKSSFAESFRNMRIRIEYIAQRETNISVLVTSAEPGDGKTFIAGNIASVYQLTGKRVILVDFDLRRPSVGKLLNLQNQKGVSNFLIGQVTLEEITINHPEYEFDVITAGTLPPNPSELIKTKRTKELINYLQTKYDYVVIDCSPIGLVSDAYILSRYVDTTLFVVRRAKTNKAFFKSVITQMKNDGFDHAALIFNDVKGREGYYGTSRYYGDKSYYLKRNSYYHDDYFEK